MNSRPYALLLVLLIIAISLALVTSLDQVQTRLTSNVRVPDNYSAAKVVFVAQASMVELSVTIYIPHRLEMDLASALSEPILLPCQVSPQPPTVPTQLKWVQDDTLPDMTTWLVTIPTAAGTEYTVSFQYRARHVLPISIRATNTDGAGTLTALTTPQSSSLARDMLPLSIARAQDQAGVVIDKTFEVVISNIDPYTTSTTSSWLGLLILNSEDQWTLSQTEIRVWDNTGKQIEDAKDFGFTLVLRPDGFFFQNIPELAHTVSFQISFPDSVPHTLDYAFQFRFTPDLSQVVKSLNSLAYIPVLLSGVFPAISLTSVIRGPNRLFPPSGTDQWDHDELEYTFRIKRIVVAGSRQRLVLRPAGHLLGHLTFMDCTFPNDSSVINPLIHSDVLDLDFSVSFVMALDVEETVIKCIAIPSAFFVRKAARPGFKYEYLSLNVFIGEDQPDVSFTASPPPLLVNSPDLSQFVDGSLLKQFSIIAKPSNYGLGSWFVAQWVIVFNFPGAMSASALRSISFSVPTLPLNDLGSTFCASQTTSHVDGSVKSPTLYQWLMSGSGLTPNWQFTANYNNPAKVKVGARCEIPITVEVNHIPTADDKSFQYFPPSSDTSQTVITGLEVIYEDRASEIPVPDFEPGHLFDTSLDISQSFNPSRHPLSRSNGLVTVPFRFTIHPTIQLQPTIEELNEYADNSVWKTQPDLIIYDWTQMGIDIGTTGFGLQSGSNQSVPDSTTWTANNYPLPPSTLGLGINFQKVYTENKLIPTADIDFGFDVTFDPLAAPYPAVVLSARSRLFISSRIMSSSAYNSKLFPAKTFLIPLEPTVAQLGKGEVVIHDQLTGTSSIPITRSADADHLPEFKPVFAVPVASSLFYSYYERDPNGFYFQQTELWYRTQNNREVLIAVLGATDINNWTQAVATVPTLNLRGYSNAFIRFRYEYDFLSNQFYDAYSYPFDILPQCMKITTQATATAEAQTESNCSDPNEICMPTTGICQAYTLPPTTPEPAVSVAKCPKCDQSNTDTCTAAIPPSGSLPAQPPTCSCIDGWAGLTCQQSTQCATVKSKCNLANGFTTLTANSCSSTCTCYNNWVGSSCQSCSLQCLNNGVNYKDCARCGCVSGYTGSQCQCQGVSGSVTLNAYNELLIKNQGKLSSIPASDDVVLFDNASQLLTTTSTTDDIVYVTILEELFKSFQKSLTDSDTGSFGFSLKPTVSTSNVDGETQQKASTLFTFHISFNCADFNPHITSLTQLTTQWGSFVESISTNAAVLKHFVFDDDGEAVGGDLTPTNPTLPTEEETLINSAFGSFCVVVPFVTILFSFVVLF